MSTQREFPSVTFGTVGRDPYYPDEESQLESRRIFRICTRFDSELELSTSTLRGTSSQ